MAIKDTRIFDLNIFSGSSELMRQALGGYYYDPASNGQIEFFEPSVENVIQIESIEGTEATLNNDFIMPKYTFGNRIFVNEANSNFISDENWRVFIVGGSYGDQQFAGIYNTNVYADHYNTSPLPLSPRELVNTSEIPSLIATTEYFNYFSRYQAKVQNVESITEIPNFYLMPPDTFDRVSTPDSTINDTQYLEVKKYLTSSYVNVDTSPDETQKNIFALRRFDLARNISRVYLSYRTFYGADSDLGYLYSLMPFGNKIEFAPELLGDTQNETFNAVIRDHNYQLKFLKTLKETFQSENRLRTSTANFAVNTIAPISTGTTTSEIQKTQTVPVKIVDAPTMLLYSYRNPDSETNDISVIASGSYVDEINCAFDNSGMYRYKNTEDTLSVLNDFVDIARENFETITGSISSMEEFLNQAKNAKLRQTLAFRIQKIGGSPTGDSNTQNTIQNIWIYNDDSRNRIYFDSQVKYDTNYTYKIFKYDIVLGTKYQLSDISTTRQIATVSANELDYFTEKQYCLEFYDPFTRQTVPSIFEEGRIKREREAILEARTILQGQIDTATFTANEIIFENGLFDRWYGQIHPFATQITKISNFAGGGPARLEVLTKFGSFFSTPSYFQYVTKFLAFLEDEEALSGQMFQGSMIAVSYYRNIYDILTMLQLLTEPGTEAAAQTLLGTAIVVHYDTVMSEISTLSTIDEEFNNLDSPFEPTRTTIGEDETSHYEGIFIEIQAFIVNFKNYFKSASVSPSDSEHQEILTNLAIELLKSILEEALDLISQGFTFSDLQSLREEILILNQNLETINDLATTAQINSPYPYLSEFNLSFEPSLKILEIPIETKNMRIVDHPPNDLVITPHHLLDQSNRLAFYCKYDTFSVNTMTYPPTLGSQDEQNRDAYLTGHDFLSVSKQTQESASPARFIEVYRVTEKPTSYADFTNNLRKTIDLKMENGDIPGDHIFTEAVQTNKKYYYVFRPVNDNGVGGQLSPVFESELIDDGGYVYANFVQHSEDDLAVPPPKEPFTSFKKLINIIPNIQHVQLDTSAATFASSSVSQMSDVHLGTQAEDTLWDADKYFKIRLTSKKTGKKIDLNIGFEKKERK
jgi:hypothetical protein